MSNIKNIKNELYVTNDLSLAATLVAWGFQMLDIDKTDDKKALFVFENNENLADSIKSYWSDLKPILPKRLLSTLKDLKSQIYSEKVI